MGRRGLGGLDGREISQGSCIVRTSPVEADESNCSTQNTMYLSRYCSAASISSLVNSTAPKFPVLDLTSQ